MDDVRKFRDYTITQSIHMGKEIIMGEDLNNKDGKKYWVANCVRNELYEQFNNNFYTDDFIEAVEIFSTKLFSQVEEVKSLRANISVPLDVITPEMCYPNDYRESIENKVVAVKADILYPEYSNAIYQIIVVTGGNGSHANARGCSVLGNKLYSNERVRYDRNDIQGVLKPECYPEWVKERVEEMQEINNRKTPFSIPAKPSDKPKSKNHKEVER